MEGTWIVFFVVAAFLIGYIFGKQAGIKKGYIEGCTETPIVLRQLSLEKGVCCLCQQVGVFRELNDSQHNCQRDKE